MDNPQSRHRHAFEEFLFLGLKLSNRFIRSATMEGMAADDGSPSPALTELYVRLANGGIPLISTSSCLADERWLPNSRGVLSLHQRGSHGNWKKAIQAVHAAGSFISIQLGPFFIVGGAPAGPQSLKNGEIEAIITTYAEAALRAREAGADAVQVHGGHGYPLAQFLSPFFNRRTDEYGGSPEKRARIFTDIRAAIARRAGGDFPVWIKMNAFDSIAEGMTIDDAEPYGPILGNAGYAAIEVTGGCPGGTCDSRGPLDKKEWFEGYYLKNAARMKAASTVPIAAVGGIRRLEMIGEILSKGMADMISLSRPLICEPDLIARWRAGGDEPSRCISCNACLQNYLKGKGLVCTGAKAARDACP